ncbi:hypothetical protein MTBUT4_410016 [Magnetospirillum sp. UT-4]|nr:hypothetical protein MTBUT4_410016 [Magnetospirillum sp. UT-4]
MHSHVACRRCRESPALLATNTSDACPRRIRAPKARKAFIHGKFMLFWIVLRIAPCPLGAGPFRRRPARAGQRGRPARLQDQRHVLRGRDPRPAGGDRAVDARRTRTGLRPACRQNDGASIHIPRRGRRRHRQDRHEGRAVGGRDRHRPGSGGPGASPTAGGHGCA